MPKQPVLVTAPAEEPVSLDELKDHLAETDSSFDKTITELGVAARVYVEDTLWRALRPQTWDQYFDRFAAKMFLRRPPLATSNAITHVKYTNTAGTVVTVGSTVYETGDEDGVPLIRPQYSQTWPSGARGHPDDVVVRTIVGYGSTAGAAIDVPGPLRHAIKLLVGDMYAHRETEVTGTIVARIGTFDSLVAPYRVRHV